MTPVAVGIDVGGTKIAGAVVDEDGAIRSTETVATPTQEGDQSASEALALIDRLARRGAEGGWAVEQAGVGVPEYVTPHGRISSALVLPSLQALPAASGSGLPILIDSDVRCAARAEARLGHGLTLASFLFVIIGTGISSTLVIDGRLWPGHRGEAIALGELPADPALALHPGGPLTVEEQASGRAINDAVEAADASGDRREAASHRAAIETRAGQIVATALTCAVQLLDPAAVVVGGGLGSSRGDFFRSLSRHYGELIRGRPQPPPLVQAHLGPQAGVIGAGLLALEGKRPDRLRR